MLQPPVSHWITHYGYIGIFFSLMLGIVGFPISTEVLLTLAGFLASKGKLDLLPTLVSASLGAMLGTTFGYGLGWVVDVMALNRLGPMARAVEDKIHLVNAWFERSGKWVLTFGYFLPGIRHFTAIVAGSCRLNMAVFSSFAYTGAFIWSVSFVLLGYYVGERWAPVLEKVEWDLSLTTLLCLSIGACFFFYKLKQKKNSIS